MWSVKRCRATVEQKMHTRTFAFLDQSAQRPHQRFNGGPANVAADRVSEYRFEGPSVLASQFH
jgi:hypothetical protein